jgi:DNA topoisomerase-3
VLPLPLPCSATYCKIYEFSFPFQGRQADMVFTSVAGHLLELEFEARVRGWHSCAPRDLYDASVHKSVPKVGCSC